MQKRQTFSKEFKLEAVQLPEREKMAEGLVLNHFNKLIVF